MSDVKKFYGKYRGTVFSNIDPMQMGRIQAIVPDVLGLTPSSWAMPCVPLAGIQTGVYVVPPLGAGVWIEFEQGNSDYPIWVGSYWGSAAEVPALALASAPGVPNIAIQTTGQNTILLSDVIGGTNIMLKTTSGAGIVISDAGLIISNGKGATIAMVGTSVAINGVSLVVTS